MTIQQIVSPENIESELVRLWEGLAKEKMRACLFNLIVFNQLSSRTDYIRDIVQKVSEKYPCRVLFVSSDSESSHPYLRTAVSVVGTGTIACDYIDIGVSREEAARVPFLLLPHIIPDLPVSLLWTEDPTKGHPLFFPLLKLANRVIFDSESADNLFSFSKTILQLKKERGVDVADLNWARTEGWRELLASLFRSKEKTDSIEKIGIVYNGRKSESFSHVEIQSMYLLAWLSSRLQWKFEEANLPSLFKFENRQAEITPSDWDRLGSGTILSIELKGSDGSLYQCARNPESSHRVSIHISSLEKCEIPHQFVLGQTAAGHSLVKEIIIKGTSLHYLEMVQELVIYHENGEKSR